MTSTDQNRDAAPVTRNRSTRAGAQRIRLLVVDDHALLRQALRSLMDGQENFEVVGEATNGREAVDVSTDEEERKQLAGVIQQEAESMRVLVDDLLYLSSLESGELPLTLDDVDFDSLVRSGIQRLSFKAQDEGVTVRHEADGGPLMGDGRRLEQVVANLLENATRFSPTGSEVSLRTSTDGETVSLVVHNRGEPIPADDLPHVFDRFYQVDPARSGAAHTGLGLAIVHELVNAHGGTVEVNSTAGEGTTFVVRLPRHGPHGDA